MTTKDADCVKADVITTEQEREAAQTRVCAAFKPSDILLMLMFSTLYLNHSLIVFCCATYLVN